MYEQAIEKLQEHITEHTKERDWHQARIDEMNEAIKKLRSAPARV